MKVTSAVAGKIIRELNDRITFLYRQENSNCTYQEVEGVAPVVPKYSYENTRGEIAELSATIRGIKHAVNVFNAKTYLPETDETIDMALVEMAQLNSEIGRLDTLRHTNPRVLSATRGNFLGSNRSDESAVQYEVANFDVEKAAEDYSKKCKALRKLQTRLDKLNNSVEFEIPYEE